MGHDPNRLRWMAFTDAELVALVWALEAADLESRCQDEALAMIEPIRAEQARRAGTHAATRTGPVA